MTPQAPDAITSLAESGDCPATPRLLPIDKTRHDEAGPAPPRKLFMSLRDISFWIGSAKADSLLKKLCRVHAAPEAFDQLYRSLPDPWSTAAGYYRYQLLKYQRALSLLPNRNYHRALDVGCGLGVLTRLLAPRAEHVLGIDLSRCAVESAGKMSAAFPHAHYRQADLLGSDVPSMGQFDLVVVFDTLYYLAAFSDDVLRQARCRLTQLLTPGGILLLVNHYYFHFDQLSRVSREIHDCFRWAPQLHLLHERRRPFYLVSVLERQNDSASAG